MAVLLLCRAPQARPSRGSPNTASAVSCGMAAAEVADETLDWLMNQPTLASAQASASIVLAVFEQVDLLAAQALGQQQTQHVLADERIHHFRREFAAAVHLGAVCVEQRLQGAGPLGSAGRERRLNAAIHEMSSAYLPYGHTGVVLTGVNQIGVT